MSHTYHFELNSKPGKDGRHTVLLRITANRKHKRIKTDIAVKSSEFDPKAEWGKWVRSRNMDNKEINQRLKEILSQAESEGRTLEKRPLPRPKPCPTAPVILSP
ncbi:Arm DNA-binding domain-containing protein [Spirosoma linguale]|uniref:Arm DNA-binding domain-containing protein n=1 Tax=Spirosoma linguale (strain ATCC 33905 / DSM 74 / LMG 10896 / Claus 1) TaxID=504472 RepID=D2QPZ2_SPILD|nr:hypothetical protein Slin_1678 [Spirosoma linguale DSM 74]